MKLDLISVDPFLPILEFHLAALPAMVGSENGVPICIEDRWVSDSHCELLAKEGGLRVRECNSKFGTLVNGRRVDGEAELNSGDILTIGVRSLRVAFEKTAPRSRAKAPKKASRGKASQN